MVRIILLLHAFPKEVLELRASLIVIHCNYKVAMQRTAIVF
ncbi:hypothetical protein [Aureispira sp. CCB-E]|nr:hypothetical protein [Aureispira sp. CCB-E]WMX17242.1 hypothetical protein QP953_12740 [Aureispira sp. CCB-E]